MDLNNSENISTTSLSFSRAEISKALHEQNAEITFTKKDGTDRVMKCTLRSEVAIPYEKKTDRTREGKENILPVWDLEADGWRSVNIDTIKEVKYYGVS
ncbi:WYL domain containing protein [uncultured Caudovirales phage]|uniref:WYL domain containing protein n=1 Tax=uncultured Caudovirales phage TaxID=2100421 RepID=A0A6J5M9T1_9CAUD|nr:WYL domain containing protein [uncultured Caudovirales phage]